MICNLAQTSLLFNQTVWRILLSSTFFIIRNSKIIGHSLTSKAHGNRFFQEFSKNSNRNSEILDHCALSDWLSECWAMDASWRVSFNARENCSARRAAHAAAVAATLLCRTAPRVFFCSILAWYHWWEFFSVKFGNFTPHRKNKQKVAWRKSTALPTERRPLFFLRKPQQQIVWTKHTAALTRRGIHKWLSYTGFHWSLSLPKERLSVTIWRSLHVST